MSVCARAWFILRNILMWLWEAGNSKTCRAVAQDRRLETQAGFLFVFFFFLWLCHAAWCSEYTGLPGTSLCFSLEFLWETSFSLLRSLTDWMGPTHIMECNFFLHAFKKFNFWLCSCTQGVSSLNEGELLVVVVSPVAKHRLQGLRASILWVLGCGAWAQ